MQWFNMKCNDSLWKALIYSGFQFDFYRKKYKFITLSAHPFFLDSIAYFTLKVAFYVATFLVIFLYKFQLFLYKFQHFSYELQHFLCKFQHLLFILTIFLWMLTNFQSLFFMFNLLCWNCVLYNFTIDMFFTQHNVSELLPSMHLLVI